MSHIRHTQRLVFVLLFLVITMCAYFFYAVYQDARQSAIDELNSRQLIHARQAQNGIEGFFDHTTGWLTRLAGYRHIADLDDQGRAEMDFAYSLHQDVVTAVTRVDENGMIEYSTPNQQDAVGRDISYQTHMQKILSTHQPVASDVFTAVQGHTALAVHVPVYHEGLFAGTIGVLVNFERLAHQFLEVITLGETGYAWMISAEGIELYCPVPGHIGKSVFENCSDFPSIIDMAEEMAAGRSGTTTYRFDRIGERSTETITKHAVYLPIYVVDGHWSICVASSEAEVLEDLVAFRNNLGIVVLLLLVAGGLFLYYAMKTWGTVREAAERRRVEASLQENEQRFRELFDNMTSGVAIYESPDEGESFVFRDLNAYGLEHANLEKRDVLGREVREVFPGIEQLGLLDVFRRVWRTGWAEHHPTAQYRDHRIFLWVENYVCRLPSGELVAIYEDTTEQHRAQEERRQLERRMQQAQRMEAIGNLAGGIAHDFNNVLFPIIGLSELLLQDLPEDAPARESVEEIHHAGQRGADLVAQILAFGRRSEHRLIPIRPHQIVNEALRLARSTIPSNIEIVDGVDKECGMVEADPSQLHQIAMNLVTNAFHAVEETGGTITVSLHETEVRSGDAATGSLPAGRYALLSVADTGHGIPPEVLDKIFEPYFTTKGQGKGTGLGLAVVFGIVKEHRGEVRVESAVGHGTTMRIYLPLLERGEEASSELSTADQQFGSEQILVIDDEPAIIELERRMLERLGYTVVTRESSTDALEVFAANPRRFDLVMTDMTMPHITGDEVARRIMKIRPDMPIIICTGYSERMSEERALAMGARGFLMKPIVVDELARMVRSVLDRAAET